MPRPSTLPPYPEIAALQQQEGLTDKELAQRLGVTAQAISMARRRWEAERNETAGEQKLAKLPWTVAQAHASGTLYLSILAYRRWEAAQQLNRADYELAMTIRRTADELGMAISYDRDEGFFWTKRRPQDGDAMFVVR